MMGSSVTVLSYPCAVQHVKKQEVLVLKTKQKQEVSMAKKNHDKQEKKQEYQAYPVPEKVNLR